MLVIKISALKNGLSTSSIGLLGVYEVFLVAHVNM